jgi:hypothetical protein
MSLQRDSQKRRSSVESNASGDSRPNCRRRARPSGVCMEPETISTESGTSIQPKSPGDRRNQQRRFPTKLQKSCRTLEYESNQRHTIMKQSRFQNLETGRNRNPTESDTAQTYQRQSELRSLNEQQLLEQFTFCETACGDALEVAWNAERYQRRT